MAAVARARCGAHPEVTIEQCDFERFTPTGAPFSLVFSAQAWHWVAPELRYLKAREALADGGLLAVFWNRPRWEDSPLHAALNGAYASAAPDFGPSAGPGPLHPPTSNPREELERWRRELEAAPRFGQARVEACEWSRTYSARDYVARVLRLAFGPLARQ